jgi:hypothetical protein
MKLEKKKHFLLLMKVMGLKTQNAGPHFLVLSFSQLEYTWSCLATLIIKIMDLGG